MISNDDAETIFDTVRFGEGATREIVCPKCGLSEHVHSLKGGGYECGNINKCRTTQRQDGCKFKLTSEHLKIITKPICPRCGEVELVENIGEGAYVCSADVCKNLKTTGGYKFRSTSCTLLHGTSNLGAYLKAAELIFSQNLAHDDVNIRTVGLSKIMRHCGLKSRALANKIRADIYQAMQPPVLKQRLQTKERCGVGRVDWQIKDRGKEIKIFIMCDMIADNFYKTKNGHKRAADFIPTRIRIAYYESNDDHAYALKTHFIPASSDGKGLQKIKHILPFIFFCPDEAKFSYSDGTRNKITGFDKSSFKHRLCTYYKEYKAMENCIEAEEQGLIKLMLNFNRPYQELGHFLCEYVFKRNIELNRSERLRWYENKNSLEPNALEIVKVLQEGFPRGTRNSRHLIKGLLTPMLPEGLKIRKNLAPARGF